MTKTPEQLDALLGSAAIPKPRKRKGNDKLRGKEKVPSGSVPALVEQGTRAYNVANMIKRGYSISEISEEYGIPKSQIKAILTEAIQQILDDAAPVALNFIWINVRRIEDMIKVVMPKIVDDDGIVNDAMMERLQSLIRQEVDLLGMAMPKDGKGGDGGFTPTMSSESPLSKLGNAEANEDRYLDEGQMTERERSIADLDDPIEGGIIYMDAR